MEFNRSAQQPAPARAAASTGGGSTAPVGSKPTRSQNWKQSPMWLRVTWIILLFSGTLLVISMLMLMYFGGSNEADYVDKDKKQAVFLTNGQVYFGDIGVINEEFIELSGIFYLNVSQQVQPKDSKATDQNQSISLVKLGCELHGPVDQMIINRDQVTFWENLKSDGQVSNAVAEWVKQNPDGQKCQTTTTGTTQQSKP